MVEKLHTDPAIKHLIADHEPELGLLKSGRETAALDAKLTARHGGVGVAQVSLSGQFLDVNDAFCDFVGYSREELLGATFQKITHPDDLDRNLELLHRLMEGGLPGYRMEKRYVRSNGEVVWADLFVSLLHDDDTSAVRLISVVADISERKKTEDRLTFLLDEMAHRSKNLLSVVKATARQIARTSTSIADFHAAFDSRLSSLSSAQTVLTSNQDAAGDLTDIVQAQLSAFLTPNDPRIIVAGPPLVINANVARAISLAIYELGTNACKYGALSSVDGIIEIRWSVDADRFNMSWVERNGPQVSPPERIGFGRKVIEQMTALSLAGDVTLAFLPEGVEWRVSAALQALQ